MCSSPSDPDRPDPQGISQERRGFSYSERLTSLRAAPARPRRRTLDFTLLGSPHQKYAIVVDWKTRPKPPYQEQLHYGLRFKGQSNLQDAQELWFEAGEPANIQFFTTDQLNLLRKWCMTHELPHQHHTR